MMSLPEDDIVKKLRRRRASRGSVYLEYLIVTLTVSFTMAVAIVNLGPGLLKHHRDVVKVVVEKAP
jgi:hypothetical protein